MAQWFPWVPTPDIAPKRTQQALTMQRSVDCHPMWRTGRSDSNPDPGGGPVVGTVEARYLARTARLYFHLAAASYHDLLHTQLLLEPLCAHQAAAHPRRRELMEPFFGPGPLQPE